jgi:hypothetical protein
LNNTVPKLNPVAIGDNDNDGVPDLAVEFDRTKIEPLVSVGEVTLTVTGKINSARYIRARAFFRSGKEVISILDVLRG